MIAPFGFDVSAFMPRQGSPAVDMARAGLAAAADQNAITQRAIESLARQKMTAQQLAFDREQLTEQARQADLLETGRDVRQQNELEQARYLDALKRAEAQRALEGGIVGDATKAFGTGDLSTLESLQQRAKIQAPQLSFQLPGSLPPANEMGIADPFASPMAGLSISRGGETLYSGDTAEMRRRNQEIVREAQGALTGGPEGESYAPYVAAGIAAAGLGGYDGKTALKDAIAGGDKAAQRQAYREGQREISLQRNATQLRAEGNVARDRATELDAIVDKKAKAFEADEGLVKARESRKNLSAVKQLLMSGAPLAQKIGMFMEQKEMIRGVASDYDSKRQAGAAGKLVAYEQILNDWFKGGEVPDAYRDQMLEAIDLMERAAQSKVFDTGVAAMNSIYMAPGFMSQMTSPEEAAQYGLQAYQNVTHDMDINAEDLAEEADRVRREFWPRNTHLPRGAAPGGSRSGGGGGASIKMRGDIVDPAIAGDLGGLGSGVPVPKIPQKAAPDPGVQRAKEIMQRLNNGGQ